MKRLPHPSGIKQRFRLSRLRNRLHKRIDSEVTGRPGDTTLLCDLTRDESHRDVAQAYRDGDADLLAAYDRFLSPTYGTVHVWLAAGALRRMNRRADLSTDLTPDLLNTAGRVGNALRDLDDDPGLWKRDESLTALTEAVVRHPEYEYALLDLARKHGIPPSEAIELLLSHATEDGTVSHETN